MKKDKIKMYCMSCDSWIDKPSVHTIGREWVNFHQGICPKCNSSLQDKPQTNAELRSGTKTVKSSSQTRRSNNKNAKLICPRCGCISYYSTIGGKNNCSECGHKMSGKCYIWYKDILRILLVDPSKSFLRFLSNLAGKKEKEMVVVLDHNGKLAETIAIETSGNTLTPIFTYGQTVPAEVSQIVSTYEDKQPEVTLKILVGNSTLASKCRSLGRFIHDGILPAPRGVPYIQVTFHLDHKGVLSIISLDKATHKETRIGPHFVLQKDKDSTIRSGQKVRDVGEKITNQGYSLNTEIDIPIISQGERWYRSTLPKVVQDAMKLRGVQSLKALNEETMSGTHITYFNLQEQWRLGGHSNVTFWSDKHGAYAAGAFNKLTKNEIDYIRSSNSLVFRFNCFYYPEYPILYFLFSIPVSDKECETLHSVANFSDGDLQEFALSVEKRHNFILYLSDEMYQHVKSCEVLLDGSTCEELINMFDSANIYFNKLDKNNANFSKAGKRFNEQYPNDFLP